MTSAAALSLLEKAALLSGANVWQTRGIERLDVPSIWLSDGPHGIRKQPGDADHLGLGAAEPAVCYPTAATIANSWDPDLVERLGRALGRDARALGVQVVLGPGMNIARSPLGGRNFEYFSEDPELTGRLAAAMVRGMQSEGVAATPKHFAANSQELRRMTSNSVVDERTLRELYLTAFEIVVREARPWALMSSYNRVNGEYTHQHRQLLLDVLRGEWGFDGAVISDWGGADDPVAAVANGGTLEMPSPGFGSARAIEQAVNAGILSERDLDARVDELLRLVERVRTAEPAAPAHTAHHALARCAASESAVLLQNDDDVLPLAPGTRVALIGAHAVQPRYQGAGSSIVTPVRCTDARSAIADTGLELECYAPGYRTDGRDDPRRRAAAVAAAAAAEVAVVCVAIPAAHESEGIDRPHLRLPENQVATVRAVAATGTPVVVVIAGGGPVELEWRREVHAIVHMHLGGQAAGEAVWDVLTGAVEPGGRLAVSVPERLADTATAGRFPADGPVAGYDEGYGIGYRHHRSTGIAPAFPFGFGLGYTSIRPLELHADAVGVRVVVVNEGARAGSEVVQLYVRRAGDPDAVPVLKGFAKVRLDAGARAEVRVPFTERTFRRFDLDARAWVVDAGEYELIVGRHSADAALTASHRVEGRARVGPPRGADVPPETGAPSASSRSSIDAGRGPTSDAFDVHSSFRELRGSPSPLARSLARLLRSRARRAARRAHPDLEVTFLLDAPLRIIHTMTGGRATRHATDAALVIANGRTLRGLAALSVALVRGRRLERRSAAAFAAVASGAAEGVPRRPTGAASPRPGPPA